MALDNIGHLILPVAQALWGPPRPGGTKTETRFGEGRTINQVKGTWFDHSDDKGGGVIALVERETGRKGREAVQWLVENGFLDPSDVEGRPNGQRPPQQQRPQQQPPKANGAASEEGERVLIKAWDYVDEEGNVLYQTLRYQWRLPDGSWRLGGDGKPAKTYMQRRKARPGEESRDGWVYNLKDVRIVPYRLPELIETVANGYTVFYVEGEKAADALWEAGIPATTSPMGAGKWWDELTPHFRGADVVILPDNDPQATKRDGTPRFHEDGRPVIPGLDHARAVAEHIMPVARRVRALMLPGLPPKGDAFDWLEAGGTAEQLYDLVEEKARDATDPSAFRAAVPFRSQFGAKWLHEARAQKPKRDWLVKDLILAGTFGIVYGPPGCGKSFLTSDMLLTMAASDQPEWFGYKGRRFGVVYVVAEGADDFEIRLHAWLADKGIDPEHVIPFVYLPTSIDLRSSDAPAKALAAEINQISEMMQEKCGVRVGAVCIDTVARSLTGGNENDSAVMSSFVANCNLIQRETGAAVIGVHHGGKEGGRGPRGHEALHGAADFEIEVTGATPETPNLWTVRKLKAGPAGATHRFRLRQTRVGEDEDGDPITSCIVVPQDGTAQVAKKEEPKGWKVNPTEREFLVVLAEVIERRGIAPPADLNLPPNVLLVASRTDVREAFWQKYAASEDGDADRIETRLRQRWSRAVRSLLRFKIIAAKEPWIWFTGKEVRDFRLRGVVTEPEPIATHVEPAEYDPDDHDFTGEL